MEIKPTKLETAKQDLLKSINSIVDSEEILIEHALERVVNTEIVSNINLPQTANSAVDGYGVLAETLHNNHKTEFDIA